LTITGLDGTTAEHALVRVPYPPHLSPSTDPFSYVVPGSWRKDPRYTFPLPWAPLLPYQGVEDLAFAPDFDDVASPEYHSYVFLWWLEGQRAFTADQVASDMVLYFRGLAQERGRDNSFTPDLSRIAARYSDGPTSDFAGKPASASLSGDVTIYDTRGKLIALNSRVAAAVCGAHTAVFFSMSGEPLSAEIWRQMEGIQATLRCGA
jgi:hypothetical protein